MSNKLVIYSIDARAYEYTAKNFFKSAHNANLSDERRAVNRQNILYHLMAEDENGKLAWGLAEGTPRGISGDMPKADVRRAFLEQTLKYLSSLEIEVTSPETSIASIRAALDDLMALAKNFKPAWSKKPFRGLIAGLETALLDLAARYHGISVSQLLGQQRKDVRISTVSFSLGADRDKFIAQSKKIAERYAGWRTKADGTSVADVIAQVSDMIALDMPDKFIWLDFNQTCSVSRAQGVLEELQKMHAETPIPNRIILEQPIQSRFVRSLAELQKMANEMAKDGLFITIMADEAISDVDDWNALFKLGGVGAVNIKVQKAGGLLPSLDLANKIMADDPTVELYIGNMLNYSELTRWQLIEICKTLPRLDYFTSGPALEPLGFCKQIATYTDGVTLSEQPAVQGVEDIVDFDELAKLEKFRISIDLKNKIPTNPGKHVLRSTNKSPFSPGVITSGNPGLGEIPRYWGRNVFSNALFEESALKRGLNTIRSSANLFFAESGAGQKMSVYAQTPMETGPKQLIYCKSKALAKFLFDRDGIRTPQGRAFYTGQKKAALNYADEIGFPVVLKPNSGLGGIGVVLNIRSRQELAQHFDAAVDAGTKRLLVERLLGGKDHRFLTLKGQTIAVWRRIPAHVTGTGDMSVRELVDQKNVEKALTFSRLKLTEDSISFLARQGVTPDTVLEKGQVASLNDKENLTQGGDAVQMLDGVHSSYYEIAEKISRSIPNYIHFAVDLMLEDCTVPATDTNWAVLEVNSRPDILGGQFPDEGAPLPLSDILFEGYAGGQLDLAPQTEEDLAVEFRLHTSRKGSLFDEVLEAVPAVVPLTISDRRDVSSEYHVAKVVGQARHIAMLSTYMFHPKMERGHHMLEVIQL